MALTIPPSTVPAVCTYLRAQTLVAAAADSLLGAMAISIGNPSPREANEHILIGGGEIRRHTDPWQLVGTGGKGWLLERVELPCTIFAASNDEPVNVMNRAFTLLSYLEIAVRTDPSMGGLVFISHLGETLGGSPEINGDGYSSEITVHLFYEAGL